jgi:dihydrofolate synthase / folylpolyglutamate synthase
VTAATAPRTLADWLDIQQHTHPQAIALGLDRLRSVAVRLELRRVARHVLTVGGTNGKGSTVAFADSIARAAGLKVGCYTSPHVLRYNERVRIGGEPVDDATLCKAFERIAAARGEVPLTVFEWGTLAAFLIFADAQLDLAVLEVGLGGRLDAVNLVDADCAVITTVALDHMALLGNDREAIGKEKAGILRRGRPAVLGELDPPDSVLTVAERVGARLLRRGREFRAEPRLGGRWRYSDAHGDLDLPELPLPAPCQIHNAACAIAALRSLLPLEPAAIAEGLRQTRLAGRLQRVPGPVEIILDVAHNPQSAQILQRWLALNRPRGATHAVFAALADKDLPGLVAPLMTVVDAWHLAGLPDEGERAHPVETAWPKVAGLLSRSLHDTHASVGAALATAQQQAAPGDRILVYGSFHTVAQAMTALGITVP